MTLYNSHDATALYLKLPDHYSYFHAIGIHPKLTPKSIIYSQAVHQNHACSDPISRDTQRRDVQ